MQRLVRSFLWSMQSLVSIHLSHGMAGAEPPGGGGGYHLQIYSPLFLWKQNYSPSNCHGSVNFIGFFYLSLPNYLF